MIRRPTERSLALAANFFSINGKTETQMVLQKGNVGRLFLWDRHRIIHHYFLVKVFVPMANSFQMIKHDSKTIQLKKDIIFSFVNREICSSIYFLFCFVVFYRHADCCQFGTFIRNPETLSGMAFTELNHGSKQLCIEENFELHYRIGEMQFFRIYPFFTFS